MTVVSNTSPIINLAAIEQLTLLHQLYGRLMIPPAVYQEIAVMGPYAAGAQEVRQQAWISCATVTDRALVSALSIELDPGEAEAIAAAVELRAELLLIDEQRGRMIAQRLGLRVVGLLGILIEAKHRGLIETVKPLLDALITRAGFWVKKDLYTRVLQAAGEKSNG